MKVSRLALVNAKLTMHQRNVPVLVSYSGIVHDHVKQA